MVSAVRWQRGGHPGGRSDGHGQLVTLLMELVLWSYATLLRTVYGLESSLEFVGSASRFSAYRSNGAHVFNTLSR